MGCCGARGEVGPTPTTDHHFVRLLTKPDAGDQGVRLHCIICLYVLLIWKQVLLIYSEMNKAGALYSASLVVGDGERGRAF